MFKKLRPTFSVVSLAFAVVALIVGGLMAAGYSPQLASIFSSRSVSTDSTAKAQTLAASLSEESLRDNLPPITSADTEKFLSRVETHTMASGRESDVKGGELALLTDTDKDAFPGLSGDAGEMEPEKDVEDLFQQESYWLNRVTYPTGRFNPAWVRQAAAQDADIQRGIPDGRAVEREALGNSPFALSTTSFTALGPDPERMTGCTGCYDYGKTAGRVNAIVVDPTTTTNGSIVAYLATIGGGVAKTTTCCTTSTTWSLLTDDPLIATTSIDTLAMDPNHHNTVYAGTGDLNYGSFSMGSQGILKTTDGGATWTVLGANVFGAAYVEPAGEFPQYDAVGKVRVDPNNSNRVVAGTKKGIFISYDAGTNWTGPCVTNAFTTQRQDTTGLELTNMGGGMTRILVAVGTRGFATPVQYDLGAQGANGLYKGTLPPSGCPGDFTLVTRNDNGFVFGNAVSGSNNYATGAPMNAGSGDPYGGPNIGNQLSRMDIAVAPSNPNVIYAQVGSIAGNSASGCGGGSGCQLGVWSSIDGGATWSFMTGSAGGSLRACSGTGTQSTGSGSAGGGDYPQNWYDQGMAVDPNNPDRVFVDTFDTWLANRTGSTFYNITCGYAGTPVANHVVHVDHHALAFVSGSSSMLLEGSDGGIFFTANANAAAEATLRPTWINMDNGLNTVEFYAGDISGNFANDPAPHAVGGAQDNGPSSVKFPGTPTGSTQWQMGLGGDGFSGQIDPMGTGPTQAVGTIALTTGGATAGQQFVIGSQTFTFVALRATTGEVTLNSSTTTEGNNIVTAINADLAGVVTSARTGANVNVTAVTAGAGGNSIAFNNINSANFSMNGSGFLGGTTQGGLPGSLRIWQGNNSGGVSRCVTNCTNSGASWASSRGNWSGDQQSFVLPINMFKGGIPGGDDCGPAGPTSGCSHLIAGTTRVYETISGANATVPTSAWYITNNPVGAAAGPNLTKGTLGNRSYINQVKYSPKYQSVAIVGTNDGNVQIGFNLGTGTASQANWVNVTGGNTVLPNRPILGIALDPIVPAANVPVGYAAVGGFNANSPTTPGHVFQVSCGVDCGAFTWLDKSGNLPDIPVDSIINNPNYPQQVFAGTDFGLYFTNDITQASPTWYRFTDGLPAVMIWDMQIDRGSTVLSLWTRGRGAYVWPLPMGPAGIPSPSPTPTSAPFCPDVTTPTFTSQTGPGGVPVTIPINSTDLTGKGVIAADVTFTYNPAVLSPLPGDISITAGTTSPTAQITYNAATPGTIVISVFDSSVFSGEGTLVDLHMKIIGPIGSVTPLGLSNFRYNGNTVCSTSASGTLTIIGGDITGRVLFENEPFPISTVSPTPTPKVVPNARLDAVGGSSFFQLSDADGYYTLSGFGPGPYTVTASRPDENPMAPNGIFSNDPSLVAQHVVGLITLNMVQQRAADVSGLHTLSSYDAALIAQWVVGVNNPINLSGKWVFTPTSTTPNTFVNSSQNYLALLMGDVNGDWSPTLMRPILPNRNSVVASVPNTKAPRGSIVTIPVSLNNTNGRGITSYQFDVHFDPAVIAPADIAADLAGTISDGFGFASNSPEPGLLKVVVYGTAPVSANGVYVNLMFRTIGTVGSSSTITLDGFRMNDGTSAVRVISGLVEVTSSGNASTDNAAVSVVTGGGRTTSVSAARGAFDLWDLAAGKTYSLTAKL